MANDFKSLDSESTWQHILEQSKSAPVAVFKHSDICGTSHSAHFNLENAFAKGTLTLPVYKLIIQQNRPLSNQIAEASGVRHQSPQILLFKDGKAVFNTSHLSIDGKKLQETAESL